MKKISFWNVLLVVVIAVVLVMALVVLVGLLEPESRARIGEEMGMVSAAEVEVVPQVVTVEDAMPLRRVVVEGNHDCYLEPSRDGKPYAYLSEGLVIWVSEFTVGPWTLIKFGEGFPMCWTMGF